MVGLALSVAVLALSVALPGHALHNKAHNSQHALYAPSFQDPISMEPTLAFEDAEVDDDILVPLTGHNFPRLQDENLVVDAAKNLGAMGAYITEQGWEALKMVGGAAWSTGKWTVAKVKEATVGGAELAAAYWVGGVDGLTAEGKKKWANLQRRAKAKVEQIKQTMWSLETTAAQLQAELQAKGLGAYTSEKLSKYYDAWLQACSNRNLSFQKRKECMAPAAEVITLVATAGFGTAAKGGMKTKQLVDGVLKSKKTKWPNKNSKPRRRSDNNKKDQQKDKSGGRCAGRTPCACKTATGHQCKGSCRSVEQLKLSHSPKCKQKCPETKPCACKRGNSITCSTNPSCPVNGGRFLFLEMRESLDLQIRTDTANPHSHARCSNCQLKRHALRQLRRTSGSGYCECKSKCNTEKEIAVASGLFNKGCGCSRKCCAQRPVWTGRPPKNANYCDAAKRLFYYTRVRQPPDCKNIKKGAEGGNDCGTHTTLYNNKCYCNNKGGGVFMHSEQTALRIALAAGDFNPKFYNEKSPCFSRCFPHFLKAAEKNSRLAVHMKYKNANGEEGSEDALKRLRTYCAARVWDSIDKIHGNVI